MKPLTVTYTIPNLSQEKDKFFADETYNPQFTYKEPLKESDLTKYGTVEPHLVDLSKEIIARAVKTYGSIRQIQDLDGDLLTLDQTQLVIDRYLQSNAISQFVTVKYLESLIPRIAVNVEGKHCLLKVRLPISLGKETASCVLDHEIGTHVFRWINEFSQPWYDNREQFQLHDHVETEEGLATLHSHLNNPVLSIWQSALYYYAVYLAQTNSFSQVFAELENLVDDPEYRWSLCVRVKRGLLDTSLPGGYTKDMVYLRGAVKVARWLDANDFNPEPLYMGKIALEDIDTCREIANEEIPLIPKFTTADLYKEKLFTIMKYNMLLK